VTEPTSIFAMPWSKIVNSTEAIANSHHRLASKIAADVEQPLRDFAASNREMQAMSTISGNLKSMAVDVDSAQKKVERLKERGAKSSADKVGNASTEVDNAMSQWESQAPYVFEKLQAIDESRCNHLRDVLTQFQTHEVDQVERNRVTAEETLNALLNVETADEIKMFSLRTASGDFPVAAERPLRGSRSNMGGASLAPTTSGPVADETSSYRSGSIQEPAKGGKLKGLKRLGTVLGRTPKSKDKKALPYGRPSSPERKSSSNLAATFSSFSRSGGRSRDAPPTPSLPRLNSSRGDIQPVSSSPPPRLPEPVLDPPETRETAERPNGTLPTFMDAPPASDFTNGTQAFDSGGIPHLPEPLQPTSPRETALEPERDAEGFSVPPSSLDAISRAEQEAAAAGEDASSPQFKLDIRNAPIQEEDGGAEAALANVASTLRAVGSLIVQLLPWLIYHSKLVQPSGPVRSEAAAMSAIPSLSPVPRLPIFRARSRYCQLPRLNLHCHLLLSHLPLLWTSLPSS